MIESIFILVGGTIGLWLLLVWELHRDVRALPITTNHCLYPENKSKGDGETQYPRPTVEVLKQVRVKYELRAMRKFKNQWNMK